MFEKVNPSHPDKVADRIAGAIVDYAYSKSANPKIAVEVLIGHGNCYIICESSVYIPYSVVSNIVERITGELLRIDLKVVTQDQHLADNQKGKIRCGDNGIFRGMPITYEEELLTNMVSNIYKKCPFDGKYILNEGNLIICQSNIKTEELKISYPHATINPLGDWTGGTNVDTGCTNRKLGSDMGGSVTGGGLHGKDASKADVSINIYAWLKANELGRPVELTCAIGDEYVDGKPYNEIVDIALDYINSIGGFEKFAEWGLIRPTE